MNNLAWTKIIAGLIVIHCWIVTYQVTKYYDYAPHKITSVSPRQVQNITITSSVEVVTKELPKKTYSNVLTFEHIHTKNIYCETRQISSET